MKTGDLNFSENSEGKRKFKCTRVPQAHTQAHTLSHTQLIHTQKTMGIPYHRIFIEISENRRQPKYITKKSCYKTKKKTEIKDK